MGGFTTRQVIKTTTYYQCNYPNCNTEFKSQEILSVHSYKHLVKPPSKQLGYGLGTFYYVVTTEDITAVVESSSAVYRHRYKGPGWYDSYMNSLDSKVEELQTSIKDSQERLKQLLSIKHTLPEGY